MSLETAQALAHAAEQAPLPAQGSVAAWASSLAGASRDIAAGASGVHTPSSSVGHQGYVARTVAAFEGSTGGVGAGPTSPFRSGSTGLSEALQGPARGPEPSSSYSNSAGPPTSALAPGSPGPGPGLQPQQQQSQAQVPPSPSGGLTLEELLLRARRATASPREALNAATATILGRLSPHRASEPNIRAFLQPTSALVTTAQARASVAVVQAQEVQQASEQAQLQAGEHGVAEPRLSAAAGILPKLDDLSSHAQMLAERMADLDQALAALSTAPS
jgi:hypothetical protein